MLLVQVLLNLSFVFLLAVLLMAVELFVISPELLTEEDPAVARIRLSIVVLPALSLTWQARRLLVVAVPVAVVLKSG